ncbi:hypothetical protein KI387_024053, partial [Taxus chinensis]
TIKRITLGDYAMVEDRLVNLLSGPSLEVRFKEEEQEDIQFKHTCAKKDKGKMVYLVDGEEIENLNFDHSVGAHEVVDSVDACARVYHESLKTKKVNIGSKEEPKDVIIGDYWSDKEVSKIIDLLHEFEDLFPRGYHDLKGVHHSLGEMRIMLKDGVCPVRKRHYRMNPNMCVRVKEELDKMIASGIIEAMEESKWISPMVISIKKDGRIRICVDYRELNVVCIIDPSPTPFIKEILEGVVGCEVYSFTDGFLGYHQ